MAIFQFMVSQYAMNIYLYGSYRLVARDGYPGVRDGYYTPVQKFAAETSVTKPLLISRKKIDEALANGWISQVEYDETISYIPVPTEEQLLVMQEVSRLE